MAAIPSPSSGTFHLGPLPIHMYGICIVIGILVAIQIAERRWAARGHDRREIGEIALWIVGAGVVGARVYHLFTGYSWADGGFVGIFEIWKGGLSIWGAILGGAIAVIVLARVKHLNTLELMDAIAPGLAVAQAFGRWGNYFNQELFGKPTTLPWGLEIDLARRPAGFERYSTFHPTFLYESIWCLVVAAVIVIVGRKFRLRKGQSFALYLFLYPLGRFFFENLRIDKSEVVFGLRFNAWIALLVMVGGAAWFMWLGRRGTPYPNGYPLLRLPRKEAEPADDAALDPASASDHAPDGDMAVTATPGDDDAADGESPA